MVFLSIKPSQIVRSELGQLLSNREFLKLFVGFGIGLGIFNAVLTLISQMIQPLYCGYTEVGNGTKITEWDQVCATRCDLLPSSQGTCILTVAISF